MKHPISFILFFLLCINSAVVAQNDTYKFIRKLDNIKQGWQGILLPDEIFGRLNPDFSDIRIIGITDNGDTIIAPYILRIKSDELKERELSFKTINESGTDDGFYFTFDISSDNPVNTIIPEFKQENFDWRIKIEGSQDLRNWFTLTNDYRIVRVNNKHMDFSFTRIDIPDSRFRYFRLFIPGKIRPELESLKILFKELRKGDYRTYKARMENAEADKVHKSQITDISLEMPIPVSLLKIRVADSIDYHRPVEISWLADSIKTEQGWRYQYLPLFNGHLSSIDSSRFRFPEVIAKKFRITISNGDNQQLKIDSVLLQSCVHELAVRISGDAKYFLLYGNMQAGKPDYDLQQFSERIPENPALLMPGPEQTVYAINNNEPKPQSKLWLWLVLITTTVLIGWFTLKMIKNK